MSNVAAAVVANVLERKDRREEEFSVTAAAGLLLFDEEEEEEVVVPKPCTDISRLSAMTHSDKEEQVDGIVEGDYSIVLSPQGIG